MSICISARISVTFNRVRHVRLTGIAGLAFVMFGREFVRLTEWSEVFGGT